MTSILVIEDDAALRSAIMVGLEAAGYEAAASEDGAAGIRALRSTPYEIVLLDIGLPFVDGWQVLQELDGHRVPSVIVISARGEEQDKVRALDLGADDYLAKPFGTDELHARIRAVLRRAEPVPSVPLVARCADVVVDLRARSVTRSGREVRLSPTEYGLLAELAQSAGRILSHRTLLQRVWGPGYGDERNYLRTFIQRLRVKLEDDPHAPKVIVTVGARGYRFGPAAPLPGR